MEYASKQGMSRQASYDLIIVGGGIAGSALALALVPGGARILILEKEVEFRDRIRGEVVMPWGSLEAKRLGIYELLLSTCAIEAGYYTRFRSGEPAIRDLCATTPQSTCCMTFPHPDMQTILLKHAKSLGVEVRRGKTVADVRPGKPPMVVLDGEPDGISARLIVLADGRESRLRSRLGFQVQRDPEQLFTAGMILEGPVDCCAILKGKLANGAKTINLFYDPQGSRMVIAMRIAPQRNRLYLIYHKDVLRRLSGRGCVDEMFRQLQAAGAPAHWFGNARQSGPFASFDGSHRWVDNPYDDGVVLIGDAAAASDPAWGRGLSRTLRDVRLLRDRLQQSSDWREAAQAYAKDHDEFYGRMRQLEAMETTLLFEPGELAHRRRQQAFASWAKDADRVPDVMGLGPDAPCDEHARARYFGEV